MDRGNRIVKLSRILGAAGAEGAHLVEMDFVLSGSPEDSYTSQIANSSTAHCNTRTGIENRQSHKTDCRIHAWRCLQTAVADICLTAWWPLKVPSVAILTQALALGQVSTFGSSLLSLASLSLWLSSSACLAASSAALGSGPPRAVADFLITAHHVESRSQPRHWQPLSWSIPTR